MRWQRQSPACGDAVRVPSGEIYHYGLFVSEDEVIQFGLAPHLRKSIPDSEIEVISTPLADFALGGELEVGVPQGGEIADLKDVGARVDLARSRLGTRGYHILYNNCEHLVTECLFGKPTCSVADSTRAFMRGLFSADLYVAPIPCTLSIGKTGISERDAEIDGASCERVKREKYAAFVLLDAALRRSFGLSLSDAAPYRTDSGKWVSDSVYFSISHSDSAVAVAVARTPIGADIEPITKRAREGALAARIMEGAELSAYESAPDEKQGEIFTAAWASREAEFKREGGNSLFPCRTVKRQDCLATGSLDICGTRHAYAVSCMAVAHLRVIFEKDFFD